MARNAITTSTGRLGQAGVGLVEALIAIALTTTGVLALAGGASVIVGETDRGRVDTDRALVARASLETALRGPFASVDDGRTDVRLSARSYRATRTVTPITPRLADILVEVTSASGATATYRTRIHDPRPLPVAP